MLQDEVCYDDFEYVVNRQEPAKICFGSTGERKTKFTAQPIRADGPTPQTYKIKKFQKPRSKRGMAGIANTSKRLMGYQVLDTPAPCKYNVCQFKPVRQCAVPFNVCVTTRDGVKTKEGTGPTVYNPHKVNRCKRTQFQYNFGNPEMMQTVEMVCQNYPTEKCVKCERPFEIGDHWHKNYSVYLCTFCMDEEHRLHEIYNKEELKTFKKIRTCDFMHRHEKTSAKIRLLTAHELNKKIRLENYLALYIKCF